MLHRKHNSQLHIGILILVAFFIMDADVHSLKTRGGRSSVSASASAPRPSDRMPNAQKDCDFLPGVKRWNRHQDHEFLELDC